ncbi:DUF3631 domain-containing protein [Gordonia polyisoprenivorans]|uniref:DUF3631 domain-containing protein n=1 Tax=Gordonia polyisoprenivorans TaxID=84595 RepID=UPI0022344105|nr:DUF3631 domain-containing protein [Gordonia polyisoprenivorans]
MTILTDENLAAIENRLHSVPLPDADGANILDEIEKAIRTYCILPSEEAYVAVTLWIAYTHAAICFDYAPRLVVRSAMKRSGKSRLLEVVAELVRKPFLTVNATEAALFRSIDDTDPPTLIFDEADTIFGSRLKAEQNEGVRGLLNAGFRKGQAAVRCHGPNSDVVEFPTFAPAALGGIGKMPDTIEDRAIVIVMKRRAADEHVKPFRIRRDTPDLHLLRNKIDQWLCNPNSDIADRMEKCEPVFDLEDRAADRWEPLIVVADMAGGSWPKRARAAAVALSQEHDADDGDNDDMQLLRDIAEALKNTRSDRITPTGLLTQLRANDGVESHYHSMTPKVLSERMRTHQVITRARKLDGKTCRTWTRDELVKVTKRYLTDEAEGDNDE